ncbi:unnamed protein product [Closterium sp. NIES-65]|nr:unnamed protein product [Closterium sp. NIES-65]
MGFRGWSLLVGWEGMVEEAVEEKEEGKEEEGKKEKEREASHLPPLSLPLSSSSGSPPLTPSSQPPPLTPSSQPSSLTPSDSLTPSACRSSLKSAATSAASPRTGSPPLTPSHPTASPSPAARRSSLKLAGFTTTFEAVLQQLNFRASRKFHRVVKAKEEEGERHALHLWWCLAAACTHGA